MSKTCEMNSYERVMAVLNGEIPDRVPVIPMIRDWTSKQLGFTLDDTMNTPEKFVYSQYYCLREYQYDAVRDLAGVHAESEAMGTKIKVKSGRSLTIESYAVKNREDVKNLRIPDPYRDGRLPMILEIIRQLKSLCSGEIPVIGYSQAPLRNAAMLKGTEKVLKDMMKKPGELHELLEITTAVQIIYCNAMINAGADIIFISDATSSGDMIAREQWEEFAYPYTLQLVNFIKKTGAKVILHVCGDTTDRLDSFVSMGIDAMSLDQKVDLADARKIVGDKFCLMGNVAPDHLLLNTPEEVKNESIECIEKAGSRGSFILSSGCQMSADTPLENMRAMVNAAHEFHY